MRLDIQDEQVRARVTLVGYDRARLTIDYPRCNPYRGRIFRALAEILVEESNSTLPENSRASNDA